MHILICSQVADRKRRRVEGRGLAKYIKLYTAVCCCIEYGGALLRLLVYEQFSTVLKPNRRKQINP